MSKSDLTAAEEQTFPIAPPLVFRIEPFDARCPYAQLDDLMAVIEALCPVWPARPVNRDQSRFLL
jgi:hypothetical protein